jgi:hypothetical protein
MVIGRTVISRSFGGVVCKSVDAKRKEAVPDIRYGLLAERM